MRNDFYSFAHKQLNHKKVKNRFRELKPPIGIDFCSNDYLGLSKDVRIVEALIAGIRIYGAGSTASRLIRGHRDVYENLEEEFSDLTGGDSALFVANGFTANIGILEAIADAGTLVFTDRLNHASILDGIRISGAKKIYYKHLDLEDLRKQLEKYRSSKHKILVSETVFSMDGDILPLPEYLKLAEEFDAVVILDESHALGVFGKNGGGLSCEEAYIESGIRERIDFRIYTLGKALGLEGGVIVFGRSGMKEYLINTMRNFIFSTAPLPAIAYAGIYACGILKSEPERIASVLKNAENFRSLIQDLPFQLTNSSSQIIPVLIPSEVQALAVAQYVQDRGIDIRAIRPPTVPISRIRISIHADHRQEELESLASALKEAAHFYEYQSKSSLL